MKPLDLRLGRAHIVVMTTFNPDIGKATRFKKGMPSPNPGGRPKSRVLSEALRAKLGEIKPDDPQGRTYAEVIATNLITIASSQGPGAVAAANEICNRLEGRAVQQLDVNNISQELALRSDEELKFFLAHGCWPENDDAHAEGEKRLV